MTSVLSLWNVIVEAGAVIAIVVIAIGIMVGAIDIHRAVGRLGAVAGTLVLLLMLPPILVSIWHSLSVWQQVGILSLLGALGAVAMRGRSWRREH